MCKLASIDEYDEYTSFPAPFSAVRGNNVFRLMYSQWCRATINMSICRSSYDVHFVPPLLVTTNPSAPLQIQIHHGNMSTYGFWFAVESGVAATNKLAICYHCLCYRRCDQFWQICCNLNFTLSATNIHIMYVGTIADVLFLCDSELHLRDLSSRQETLGLLIYWLGRRRLWVELTMWSELHPKRDQSFNPQPRNCRIRIVLINFGSHFISPALQEQEQGRGDGISSAPTTTIMLMICLIYTKPLFTF